MHKEIAISIIMGSKSDLHIMQQAANLLKDFSISYELTIISAHRTPERMFEYAKSAQNRGIKIIIAGAGGAAHLPGMVASITPIPVIGVPIRSSNSLDGWDSILSILQMPNGIPVATVALDAAKNAALLSARILAISNPEIKQRLDNYHNKMQQSVYKMVDDTKIDFPNYYD